MSVLKDECGKDVVVVDRNTYGAYVVRFMVHGLWFDISSVCNQHDDEFMYKRCVDKAMQQLNWYADSDDVLDRRAANQIKCVTVGPVPTQISSYTMTALSMWRKLQKSQ